MFSVKMPAKKYFIAIVIPEPLYIEIEAVKNQLLKEYGLKGALRSPAHITLHRPFEWKEEKENVLIDKLKEFSFNTAFDIELKNYSCFEPRVIYVDVVANGFLTEMHKQLSAFAKKELKLFNEVEDKRGFHPHVTVAFRDLKKPEFYELQAIFDKKKLSGVFKYDGFSLLKLEKKWTEINHFQQKQISAMI